MSSCAIACVVVPGALFLYLLRDGAPDALRNINLRRRCAILFDGFRDGMSWWAVLMFLRTGGMILVAHHTPRAMRLIVLAMITIVSFSLQFFLQPFEHRFRDAVHHFELFAQLGVLAVLIVGELDLYGYTTDVLSTVVLLYNCCVFLLGFLIVLVSSVSIDVEAILEAGSTVSNFTRRVHRLVRIYPGVSPVYYYYRNGSYFIDISQLNAFERLRLEVMLRDTVSACVDASDKFKTRIVERALSEGFRRAMQARTAKLRNYYYRFGTHPFRVWRVFAVTLRAPDIPLLSEEQPAPGSAGAGPTREEASCGVTVDELNDALLDVNADIKDRHPCIISSELPTAPTRSPESDQVDRHFSVCSTQSLLAAAEECEAASDDEGEYKGTISRKSLFSRHAPVCSTSTQSIATASGAVGEGHYALLRSLQEESANHGRARARDAAEARELEEEAQALDQECEELWRSLQRLAPNHHLLTR